MEMVWCPPGTFMMGSPEEEEGRNSGETLHQVTLTKGFWMAKYEVTRRQWNSVMEHDSSPFAGDELPMQLFSHDAQNFCEKTGLQLPTEAQWEYACRAGSEGRFGGTGNPDEMGWYGENGRPHPVGQKSPNAWGLHDMHGNMWEFCADWDGEDYSGDAVTDPTGPATGDARVMRGGSVVSGERWCRSACRMKELHFNAFYGGFRPVSVQP